VVADHQGREHQGAIGRSRASKIILDAALHERGVQKATIGYWGLSEPNAKPHATTPSRETITRYWDAHSTRHYSSRARALRHSIAPRRNPVVVHKSGGEPAHAGNDNSDKHCQGEPPAAPAAERHERIGPRDTDRHSGKRNHQRQHQRRREHNQRHICKRMTPTSTFDQFVGHGHNPAVRITLVPNMAPEPGAVPAQLRRRFWRTTANMWRMVNERLKVLSLSRAVAETTHAASGEEI
jgi:hypothetical protein